MKKDIEGVVRKETLIAKTRKSVFIWVGGAACVVGIAAVIVVIMVQSIMFNFDIIGQKRSTETVLKDNIAAVPELEANIRQLNTNKQLKQVSLNDDVRPLQSILDALPADDNRLALGASLQQKLLTDVPGLVVDSLSVDPANVSVSVSSEGDSVETGTSMQPLAFTASLSGNEAQLKQALQRLERSIRAINVQTISANSSSSNVSLQITGSAYFLPESNLEITVEEVKQQ